MEWTADIIKRPADQSRQQWTTAESLVKRNSVFLPRSCRLQMTDQIKCLTNNILTSGNKNTWGWFDISDQITQPKVSVETVTGVCLLPTSSASVFHQPHSDILSTVWSSTASADQEGKSPHLLPELPDTEHQPAQTTGSNTTSKKKRGSYISITNTTLWEESQISTCMSWLRNDSDFYTKIAEDSFYVQLYLL